MQGTLKYINSFVNQQITLWGFAYVSGATETDLYVVDMMPDAPFGSVDPVLTLTHVVIQNSKGEAALD